jgi:hypothetical protein
MPRRTWEANTQALIIREGLQGKPVAELCPEPQSSQRQSYQWRDPCLAQAAQAFEAISARARKPTWSRRTRG